MDYYISNIEHNSKVLNLGNPILPRQVNNINIVG